MSKSIGHAFIRRHFFKIAAGVLFSVSYPAGRCVAADTIEKSKDAHPCSATVYVADPDPNGLNIRFEPNKNAAIVQVIPFDATGTTVDVTAGYGNWMRISGAQGFDTDFRLRHVPERLPGKRCRSIPV